MKKTGILRCIKLGFVTFFVNSFWLLPVIYFALVSPGIPGSSHINSVATPETQIMNQARSGFIDIATLKGYWFDYFDWGRGGGYDYLYRAWISHSGNFLVISVSVGLFFVSVLGLLLGIFKKKEFRFSYLILLPICYFMLAGGQIPVPFFAEAFRNAFTKWSVALALVLSVGLGSFVHFLGEIYWRRLAVFLSVLVSLFVIAASVYTVYPVFKGGLIAESMRIHLPDYYLEAVGYFKNQDTSVRIALFPLTDFWGWQFNDWGYRGSGFIWYGLPRPILSRTFDVWSPKNEGFYDEISHAVNSGDMAELRYVLSKYQVGNILFDGSIFVPGNPAFSQELDRQKRLIESSGFILKEKEFGKITLYRVDAEVAMSFVSAPKAIYEKPYVSFGKIAREPIITESFSDSQGYQLGKNCNLKGVGSVIKEKREGGNYYKAEEDGVSCDYFYYSDLDSSKAYLMRIKGKNLNGRSLKFYLYSAGAGKAVSEELLPNGGFDKSYYVLPISQNGKNKGYTLNVETRAFGKVKSENLITGIEFYPVEFSYSTPTQISNNLEVKNVKKYGTWGYKVDVQGDGLIELGQGYDLGWIAIQPKNLHLLEHQKLNGWANAWVVPSNQPTNQSTIYLVFWPQLLEWGGMAFGLITLLTLARRKVY